MTAYKAFDLLESPLDGINLIEASAGTGKTYAIAGLFLRLLLEKGLPVGRILVVTFTQAATEELRERVRIKLRDAVRAFSSGESDDPFLKAWAEKRRDVAAAIARFEEALRAFDEAAIYTIHGFCRRMLHDNAFESGSLFDTELVAEQKELDREVVDDFWRRHFYDASPLFVNYALKNRVTPSSLAALLSRGSAQAFLKITPRVEPVDPSPFEKDYLARLDAVHRIWVSAKEDVGHMLNGHEGLHRGRYDREKIPRWMGLMDAFVERGGNDPLLFKGFEKFTTGYLAESVKKGRTPPAHPFFDLCEELQASQRELEAVYARRVMDLQVRLLSEGREELAGRRAEKNVQTFDDLLLKLHGALEGEGGEALSMAVRARFGAALIDEFQDTDPVQYAIFRKIFGSKKTTLFFIGDPKQAIYGFRGADIFAYMEASKEAEGRYTLRENWRSDPGLIAAINSLFVNPENPFLYREIGFEPAVPAKGREPEILRVGEGPDSPFQVWYMDAGRWAEPGKAITKGLARELIPRAVASEISRLLTLSEKGRASWRGRPLRKGDVAVLVRRNTEAILMQKALSELHIPSVLYSTENLFESHEAMEMERVLAAMVESGREGLIRAAITTDMTGVKGEELEALVSDEGEWERWLVKFEAYHDLWRDRGFIRMCRAYLSGEGVLTRLISFADGERRNTNVLHLMEVLHRVSVEKRLEPAGLLKWLAEQRASGSSGHPEHQLRLESDENAVKLVTVHKSKGLEYPVVFCPFAWDGSRLKNRKDPFLFHDGRDGMQLTLDLGSDQAEENRLSAEREQLGENLRLLYVALSRAKGRVYLVWGRFKEAGTSASAYLLYPPPAAEVGDDVVPAMEERFTGLKEGDLLKGLEEIAGRAKGAISIRDLPARPGETRETVPEEAPDLVGRTFSGTIDRQWRISSFSSLVSSFHPGEEAADHDAAGEGEDGEGLDERLPTEPPAGIFSFPKGIKTGTFLHDLLEHLDFAECEVMEGRLLVAEKLAEYGFGASWEETIHDMVARVLSAPLDPGLPDLRLSAVRKEERLNELAFTFPLKRTTPNSLRGLFSRHRRHGLTKGLPERIGSLTFSPVRGFMRGFVDMVFRFQERFYLVDWKSNFLGPRVEDYGPGGMAAAMDAGFYRLQYHLYAVALNQYLRLRLKGYRYERDFGGVYYIFLRGVDPEKGPEFGVFRDRPQEALIEELSKGLIGSS